METLILKSAYLLLFAAFLLLFNTLENDQPWRALSFYGMIACLVGSGWFLVQVVFS